MVHCLRKRKSGAILFFKSICGSKANKRKCLILFATVLFIVEEH